MASRRDELLKRHQVLKTERSSFDAHWAACARFISPRTTRFEVTDRNKGDRRFKEIINSHATQALRIARAGMFAGIMSPARPWFALETTNPDFMESGEVRDWLYRVEGILRAIFLRGNLYNMAPVALQQLLLFGTSAMMQVDDFEAVARFYTQPMGSYCLAQNDRYEIDTFSREFQMTTRQMVSKFGLDNVSRGVKNAWDQSNYEGWWTVNHYISPNAEYSDGPFDKPWKACYFQPDAEQSQEYLLEEGFYEFPIVAPRWDVLGEDVYATDCPAMTALGDITGMQIQERRLAQGIEKQVNPPMQGPPSLRNVEFQNIPGGLTIYDADPSRNKLEPIYAVAPQVDYMARNIERTEARIDGAFLVDLFRRISNDRGIQPKNELYLTQLHEEQLLELGPTLERVHGEFLSPILDRTFNQAARAGILPPAPEILAGQPLKAEYISTLAMAQRAQVNSGIDRLVFYVGGLRGAGWQDAGDMVNSDQSIREYSRALGVPPRLIRSDTEVAQIREARQKQVQAQQAMEMMAQGANTAKMLSDAKTTDPSALTAIAGAMG